MTSVKRGSDADSSDSVCFFSMSSQQLHELWSYEAQLANTLLDLPYRKCSGKPCIWGEVMSAAAFDKLKKQIRCMWSLAAQYFQAIFSRTAGWGLKVKDDLGKTLSLSPNSSIKLGWLVKCPRIQECETGHRYLRSPAATNLYLGGPLSLLNFDSIHLNVSVHSCPNVGFLCLNTVKAILPGAEVMWSYNFMKQNPSDSVPLLHQTHEWFLENCCTEGNQPPANAKPQREAEACRPSKKLKLVASFQWCTFCGQNLEEGKKKVNLKEHLAVHHAVDICREMQVNVDEVDPSNGVNFDDFCAHLDVLVKVYRSLCTHGYQVVPACRFLQDEGMSDISFEYELARVTCYEAFCKECRDAFQKYKVLHLKGLQLPLSFDDLVPSAKTSFKDVIWKSGKRPASNSFTAKTSEEDQGPHKLKITSTLQAVVQIFESL